MKPTIVMHKNLFSWHLLLLKTENLVSRRADLLLLSKVSSENTFKCFSLKFNSINFHYTNKFGVASNTYHIYSQFLGLWVQFGNFQFPIILCMGNFENRANIRLQVFEGFTRFGVGKSQKTQNQHSVRVIVSMLVYYSVETISFEQIVVKTSFWF